MTGTESEQLAIGDVPDLHFAHARRPAAGDGELRAVGREADRLDSLGHADQPGDEAAAIGFVQQHFVEAGDGQQRAVGRPIERRDHGRAAVDGRMLGVDRRRGIGRRVVFGAFFDPAADEGDLGSRRAAACPAASPLRRSSGVICSMR